jgi:hypothetical protein
MNLTHGVGCIEKIDKLNNKNVTRHINNQKIHIKYHLWFIYLLLKVINCNIKLKQYIFFSF